jgi:hypothetical protein
MDEAQIGALERAQGEFAAAFGRHWIPLENYWFGCARSMQAHALSS